jgi:hypothetical protein
LKNKCGIQLQCRDEARREQVKDEDEGIKESHIPDQTRYGAALGKSTPAIKKGRGHEDLRWQRWIMVGKL